jgi:hypothetical protein
MHTIFSQKRSGYLVNELGRLIGEIEKIA